ncbi:unnamed protein product [Ceratitis capitata]|uniref:(Mediterranean fruit fly) hypothetical protein n=1 Tax=Ceratitis capitata TaxID=7213 RepID=A0A811U588_CERCA|nr:unnamed protein product [Ceratitis capitata]
MVSRHVHPLKGGLLSALLEIAVPTDRFMANSDRNNAQPSCAGLFVGAHLGFDYPGVWMHVDMATPVASGERATGYGVALLLTLFGNYTKCSMLQSIAPNEAEPPTKRVCRD